MSLFSCSVRMIGMGAQCPPWGSWFVFCASPGQASPPAQVRNAAGYSLPSPINNSKIFQKLDPINH